MTANLYDPRTRRIYLRPDASLYSQFHEMAHKEQHERGLAVFWTWFYLRRIRLIGYLVTIWIEFDAYRRARRAMQRIGVWSDEYQNEARKGLMSYVTRKAPQ